MTIKEIQGLQLSLSAEGFALCKQAKDGSLQPVRKFTNQEITAIVSAMYLTHIKAHPDDKVMLMPLDNEGNALAIGYAKVAPTAAKRKPAKTKPK